MKLKELDVASTLIWISNLDKVAKVYNLALAYHKEITDKAEREFEEHYSSKWFYRTFTNANDYKNAWYEDDGKHYTFGWILGIFELSKMTVLPDEFPELANQLAADWATGYPTKLERTITAWSKYAKRPFEITTEDLTLYFEFKAWHSLLKDLTTALGIYNEALDLDEDCM